MTVEMATPVFWIDPTSVAPICDVPWVGRAIIEPTGKLKFCCFTSHTVGDINTASFEELWNGKDMQRIRRELAAQRLPPECQTNACPIFRHDKDNYIVRRLDEQRESNEFAEHVSGNVIGNLRIQANSNAVDIELELAHRYLSSSSADLVIGIRRPDGSQVFLPDFESYPMPFCPGMGFEGESPIRLSLVKDDTQHFRLPGVYEVCSALFARDSDLNFLSNCLWSYTAKFTI